MEQSILLRARLKNCLTTILDMEEDFHSRGLDTVLRGELDFLKKYMDRVDADGPLSASRKQVLQ